MNEPKSFCHGEATYVPVRIEEDGMEWICDPVWEGCEHGRDPFDPDNFDPVRERQMLSREPSGDECPNPVEYVGKKFKIQIQFCGKHFEGVKHRSRVRFVAM